MRGRSKTRLVGRGSRGARRSGSGRFLLLPARVAGIGPEAGRRRDRGTRDLVLSRFDDSPDYTPRSGRRSKGRQRMMMHIDIGVDDVAAAVAEAIERGATLAEFQPQEDVRVLYDPAGHPFCLYLDEDEDEDEDQDQDRRRITPRSAGSCRRPLSPRSARARGPPRPAGRSGRRAGGPSREDVGQELTGEVGPVAGPDLKVPRPVTVTFRRPASARSIAAKPPLGAPWAENRPPSAMTS